jgi:predicted membrane chloride channel (bestrophin family)
MINYNRSAFGLNLLFRLHGSAIYRSVLPALMAVALFLCIRIFWYSDGEQGEELAHPYAIGVVVGGTTFLIVFRASQGYSRYWEATGSIYNMMSKWMDATIHTAAYHMQCDHYDHIKPPSFYDYPELDSQFLTRDRERIRQSQSQSPSNNSSDAGIMKPRRAVARSINVVDGGTNTSNCTTNNEHPPRRHINTYTSSFRSAPKREPSRRFESAHSARDFSPPDVPRFLTGEGRLCGGWSTLFPDGKATFYTNQPTSNSNSPVCNNFPEQQPPQPQLQNMGFASTIGGHTPPLFLQELAHLASLLTAVALSTLRNDVDGAESPLDYYEIGSPWPEVDAQQIPEVLSQSQTDKASAAISFFLGIGRAPEDRTRYNASRPLHVIGGVSDNEIRFLQMARGPSAKTQLCWNWLSEFITREYLSGSTGVVGPPIISRVIQFLGDGMTQYNHARKIMFIPFPFPHAQLSATFVHIMIPLLPILMNQYCQEVWSGVVLTFFSVMCLMGINEVGRELENPFRNVPNELPVVTLMAEFNEALITMYSGYHPDFFWNTEPTTPPSTSSQRRNNNGPQQQQSSFEVGGLDTLEEEVTELESSKESLTMKGEEGEEEEPTNNTNEEKRPSSSEKSSSSPQDSSNENWNVDKLRAIVEQQGKMMELMLEEQTRLNQMIQAAFCE